MNRVVQADRADGGKERTGRDRAGEDGHFMGERGEGQRSRSLIPSSPRVVRVYSTTTLASDIVLERSRPSTQ